MPNDANELIRPWWSPGLIAWGQRPAAAPSLCRNSLRLLSPIRASILRRVTGPCRNLRSGQGVSSRARPGVRRGLGFAWRNPLMGAALCNAATCPSNETLSPPPTASLGFSHILQGFSPKWGLEHLVGSLPLLSSPCLAGANLPAHFSRASASKNGQLAVIPLQTPVEITLLASTEGPE